MKVYALIALWTVLLCSCTRTVFEPMETVRTEYEQVTKWRTDTVIDRDTVSVIQRGDTLVLESIKWRWRTRETHDTVYVERIDSVAVPYPVEKKLTAWQRAKVDYGGFAMVGMALCVCAVAAWLARKFRR